QRAAALLDSVRHDDDPTAAYERGRLAAQHGDWRRAAEELVICLRMYPAHADARSLYGQAARHLGERAAATEAFAEYRRLRRKESDLRAAQADTMRPGAPVAAWETLARLQERLGDGAGALQTWQRASTAFPKD